MWLNPLFSADLVTFTEEILNGKVHFLFSDTHQSKGNIPQISVSQFLHVIIFILNIKKYKADFFYSNMFNTYTITCCLALLLVTQQKNENFEKFPAIILEEIMISDRNRRPEVFYKNFVLRNFAKFTGKHMCQSIFFK